MRIPSVIKRRTNRLILSYVDSLPKQENFEILQDLINKQLPLFSIKEIRVISKLFFRPGLLDYGRKQILLSVDSPIGLDRLNACRKEPETVAWIETNIKPGDVLYDIGANVGAYSFVADAITEGNSVIYAIEPSFSTFDTLSKNVQLNNCQGRVIPLHIALSNKTGLANFNYSSVESGGAFHSVARERVGKKGQDPEFVQPILSFRLDDLVDQFHLRLPNHIKLDVDGDEFLVLEGAPNILSSSRLKTLMIESDVNNNSYERIVNLLEEYNFKLISQSHRGTSSYQIINCVFSK